MYINFGGTKIYPNLYIMIIGNAGSRKSTAIKHGLGLLRDCKYSNLAATATSREQFFEDFGNQVPQDVYDSFNMGLITNKELDEYSCNYTVIADEFNDFAGVNNVGMYTSLANLWDYRGMFDYRPKHGKKVSIINPVLNILSGNTADGFANAFPAQTINQGLPSRTILINSLGRRRKIYWPEAPDLQLRARVIAKLQEVQKLKGEIVISPGAKQLLKDIYENWKPIQDSRFVTYGSRRYQQLLKLAIIIAASYNTLLVTKEIIVEANSILTFAEKLMPDALGEFGLNKFSVPTARILDSIKYCPDGIMTIEEIYASVSSDVKDYKECQDLIMNLYKAKKVQVTKEGITYMHRNSIKNPNDRLHCNMQGLWENENV